MGLSDLMRAALEFFYRLSGNYGIAIIALTLAIRLVLYPFTWKQTEAMEQMKELQPHLKRLQEKYKDNKEEYQKRVIDLYREHKINPLGGCLPLLLQLPFIWALFNVLRTYSFTAERFLWLSNLSRPDPWYILPALAGITTYIQGAMVMADPSQKTMNLIGPVFMAWITISLPSGIGLYFVATNIFSIGQQYLISRHMARKRAARLAKAGPDERVKLSDPDRKGSIPRGLRTGGAQVEDEGSGKDG